LSELNLHKAYIFEPDSQQDLYYVQNWGATPMKCWGWKPVRPWLLAWRNNADWGFIINQYWHGDLIEQHRPIEHDISVYVYMKVIPSV